MENTELGPPFYFTFMPSNDSYSITLEPKESVTSFEYRLEWESEFRSSGYQWMRRDLETKTFLVDTTITIDRAVLTPELYVRGFDLFVQYRNTRQALKGPFCIRISPLKEEIFCFKAQLSKTTWVVFRPYAKRLLCYFTRLTSSNLLNMLDYGLESAEKQVSWHSFDMKKDPYIAIPPGITWIHIRLSFLDNTQETRSFKVPDRLKLPED